MPRNARREGPDFRVIHNMINNDETPLEEKLQYLVMVRTQHASHNIEMDRFLLREVGGLRAGLRDAQELQKQLMDAQNELEAEYKKLTAPPFHPATFLEYHQIGEAKTALVNYANALRFVVIAEEFSGDSVKRGDQVLLSGDLNLLVGTVSCKQFDCGETVVFERYTNDGRLVVSRRDEEIIVNPSDELREIALKKGDEIRWSATGQMAFERIDSPTADHLFLEEAPRETFADIGGLDEQIEELKNLVLLHFEHPELTAEYGLKPRRGAILEGPPGTGKTMLVKGLVNFLKGVSPSGQARFINIKPGELGSMWYSETERKIRELFDMAGEAADAEPGIPVVVFLDEVDWIAASRGATVHHVDDRAVGTLAVALDGLQTRGNVLVIAATNRMDMLDPALIRPERFGDMPIRVNRPSRAAARAILGKYFREELPYARDTPRDDVIESTLARVYSPNGDGDVATAMFRRRHETDDSFSTSSSAERSWPSWPTTPAAGGVFARSKPVNGVFVSMTCRGRSVPRSITRRIS